MRIQIVSIPKGEPPLWIRKAMVGLVFSVIEEADFGQYTTLKNKTPQQINEGREIAYFVAKEEITRVLNEKENKDAIEWFGGIKTEMFFFLKIYCRQTL